MYNAELSKEQVWRSSELHWDNLMNEIEQPPSNIQNTFQHHEFSQNKYPFVQGKTKFVDEETYTSNHKECKSVQANLNFNINKSKITSKSTQWSVVWNDKQAQVSLISAEDVNKLITLELDRKAFASEKSEFEKARSISLKQIEKYKIKVDDSERLLKEKDKQINQLTEELKNK